MNEICLPGLTDSSSFFRYVNSYVYSITVTIQTTFHIYLWHVLKCKYGILRRGKMTLQLHVVTVLQLSVEEELPLPHHPSSPSKGHLNAHSTNWWYQLGEKRSICTSRWSIFIVLTISTLLRNKLENGDKRRDEVC